MDRNIFIGLIIGILIILSALMAILLYPLSQNKPLPIIKPATDFTLINQDNETVSLKDFQGKIIMLGFIYTSCTDECITMTLDFKAIQNELGIILGTEAMLLCITLDPLFDTPTVLKTYAEQRGANLDGWQFLTAYDIEPIEKVINDYGVLSYTDELDDLANVTNHENDTHPNLIFHSWISILIDQNQMIRRIYTRISWILSAVIEDMKSLLSIES